MFMKKKIICGVAIVGMVLSITGCEQTMAKHYGGDMTVELEPGLKLEEITWKDDDLWYLTRPMRDDEEPETHKFEQSSNWGVFEGTITVIETRE